MDRARMGKTFFNVIMRISVIIIALYGQTRQLKRLFINPLYISPFLIVRGGGINKQLSTKLIALIACGWYNSEGF